MFRFVMLSLLLGCPALAWWPKLPGVVRKAAACLALAPVVAGLAFALVALVTGPSQFIRPAAVLLPVSGTMLAAGAYALWPRDLPRRNRVIAGLFFVIPVLGLFTLAEVFVAARGGTVVGKVTFKGQPVPSGTVSMLSEGGVVRTGVIRPDGRYVVFRVPPGPVKIAVATYPPPPPGPVHVPAPPYVPIPPRYRDFDKSPLGRIVTGGGQRQNLDLQP